MKPVAGKRMLRRRLSSLNRRERLARGIESRRRRRIKRLSHQKKVRLRKKGRTEQRRLRRTEYYRSMSAKRETAKLNRTLRRRRKR